MFGSCSKGELSCSSQTVALSWTTTRTEMSYTSNLKSSWPRRSNCNGRHVFSNDVSYYFHWSWENIQFGTQMWERIGKVSNCRYEIFKWTEICETHTTIMRTVRNPNVCGEHFTVKLKITLLPLSNTLSTRFQMIFIVKRTSRVMPVTHKSVVWFHSNPN